MLLESSPDEPRRPVAGSAIKAKLATEIGTLGLALNLRQTIYAQVCAGQIMARIVGSDTFVHVDCDALMNPRTLMGDYDKIEGAFKRTVSELRSKRRMLLKPKILIHLLPKFEGGYTDVELRAFREVGISAGCAEAWMLVDYDPVPDEDIQMLFDGPLGMSIIPTKEQIERLHSKATK